VKSEVQARLEKRGIKLTLVDKTIGYELRCAPPIPYDAEHARDLGYVAVSYLQAGGSGAMITMQDGVFTPVPFNDVIDYNTGRGKLRAVDITTESYQVARDYMVRINAKDFADSGWVEELARAAGMSVSDFKARFARLAQK
jgi:ATP-dependent phosphofructokinase / diphosphate-dependent phosphofructokinase